MSGIFNHLWQSTLFAAAVALACSALRQNSPRLRYWLWLAASLKFLVPFAVIVSMGARVQFPRIRLRFTLSQCSRSPHTSRRFRYFQRRCRPARHSAGPLYPARYGSLAGCSYYSVGAGGGVRSTGLRAVQRDWPADALCRRSHLPRPWNRASSVFFVP